MFCLDPVIIVVLQDYFPNVEAARTFSAFQRRHHSVPSGTIFSGEADRLQRCCIPHHVGTDTTSPPIGLLSAVLPFLRPDFTWVCLAPSQPPTPCPDPLLLPCKMPDEVRLGVHVGSCYLATAVISHDSASTRQPLSPSFGFPLAQEQPFFLFFFLIIDSWFPPIAEIIFVFFNFICDIWVKEFFGYSSSFHPPNLAAWLSIWICI